MKVNSHIDAVVLLEEHINNLGVIGSIVDLLVLGGNTHVLVPGMVDGPGACCPLSHLVVVLDRGIRGFLLSHPVHDLVIISRVINALWPRKSPVLIRVQSFLGDSFQLDGSGQSEAS